MSRNVRVGVVIGLIVAMAAALVVVLAQDSGEPEPRAAAPTATATTSGAPSPAQTSPQPVAVPTPDLTGDDYERIFREIMRFRDWLYEHPDPQLADLIFAENCECHDVLVEHLRELNKKGQRFDDDGFRVQSVELRQDLGQTVRIVAEIERTPQRLVNKDGELVETYPSAPARPISVSMVRDGPAGWRVASIVELSERQ